MKKMTTSLWAAILALGVAGCAELTELEVVNENAPDAERALSNPSDVEALIGASAATWWDAISNIQPFDGGFPAVMSAIADESSMSWTNWSLRVSTSEPRVAWPNESTYSAAGTVQIPYQRLYSALSAARDGIVAINDGLVIEDAVTTNRALAFAKFIQGVAHGYLALHYDQANILTEDTDLSGGTLEFVDYQTMMAAALAKLEESRAIAAANTFTTPPGWFNGFSMTNDQLVQVAHGFSARFMAGVARTPAAREAADWTGVNGILAHIDAADLDFEFAPIGDEQGGAGPWYDVMKYTQGGSSWARADYRTIGGVKPNDPETDPDGTYAAWLASPVQDRDEYKLNTADKRIQGIQGFDQCADPDEEAAGSCGNLTPGALNPGLDFRYAGGSPFLVSRGTYHFSNYKPTRYDYHTDPNGFGPMTMMTPTEMDLLKAEGHLRNGLAGAAALINQTRVTRGQLSAAADADADIWEKLYYEKFIEQFNLAPGLAFTERRGAPDIPVTSSVPNATLLGLVPLTPRHWPVPGAELEVLQLPNYTFGGANNPDMAIAGTRMTAPVSAVYRFDPDWTAAEKLNFLTSSRRVSGLTSYR